MKLLDFKDIHEYTSSYQVAFEKVIDFLTLTFHHTQKNNEMYFQATMLMNMRPKYFKLISAIQKNLKDKTTNLIEAIL